MDLKLETEAEFLPQLRSKDGFGGKQMSRTMDNLSRDATAAIACGMSYGKYKALHPFTKVPEIVEPECEDDTKVCPQCGTRFRVFTGQNRKTYCSMECQRAHSDAAARRRYREKKAAAAAG